ncbi:tRNA threonylcarbamoyl adenosine modification protein YeaZ [Abditibacterium utsteinense]|uniref:tRNA threonylcarbamoyl adenosine modification protein YeaZ n=1 Tax=Abditibacterium utsteinense TaxID=1960156 RepID=A0A2S8SX55_9BACT|nr:tRNA (adenosine(37)-N6)-threonylcarbamoyltransferase complex dimerization subunit type 1 TsaB [Abditibacterium utsteinense]PQV65375.1 tRNA threonylcarbamoyl adenosine modification protein YeaZ [Abditibacterium utsteinense]
MKIIALECGGAVASLVALETWGQTANVTGESILEEPRALSRLLIERFDVVLRQSKWKMDELDGLAIGIGPGSWTSLRIGLSTFKTLAQTLKIPLAGVPSFDALAAAVYGAKREAFAQKTSRKRKSQTSDFEAQILLAVSPCRPGEFYGKIFEMTPHSLSVGQSEWIASAQMHLDAAFCQGLASEIEPPLFLCGDAASEVGRLLGARGEIYDIGNAESSALALEIALAGAAQIVAGEAENPLDVKPLYLAPSHAERYLAERNGGVYSS